MASENDEGISSVAFYTSSHAAKEREMLAHSLSNLWAVDLDIVVVISIGK